MKNLLFVVVCLCLCNSALACGVQAVVNTHGFGVQTVVTPYNQHVVVPQAIIVPQVQAFVQHPNFIVQQNRVQKQRNQKVVVERQARRGLFGRIRDNRDARALRRNGIQLKLEK